MAKLEALQKTSSNMSNNPLKAIKDSHMMAYVNEGEPQKVRKSVLALSGFASGLR